MTKPLFLAALLFAVLGCDELNIDWDNMNNQPRYKPDAASSVLPNDTSAQTPPPGTVSRTPTPTYAQSTPETVDLALLRRGRERFNIYCAVCHGEDGYGEGMVVRRGFPQPPSLHEPRLREASDRYLYDVISNGLGKMPSYAYEVGPRDRHAVVAYIRALQLSQHATPDAVPADHRAELEASPAVAEVDPADPGYANPDQNQSPTLQPIPAPAPGSSPADSEGGES